MKSTSWQARSSVIAVITVIACAGLVASAWRVLGANDCVPLATDWSHGRLIFSPPANLIQQFHLSGNRRYVQQWIRRHAEQKHYWHGWFDHQEQIGLAPSWSVDLGTGATVGAGNYPAKYSFDITNANCGSAAQPDFVVYNTNQSGANQPGLVALDNLYSGCGGTVPSTYWSFNTGGVIATSVALSMDGTQIAAVQNAAGASYLLLLKWAAGSGAIGSPVAPRVVGAADYRNCQAPCEVSIPFSTANGAEAAVDSHSPPFVDYEHDAIYVGENHGYLHKFTGVFYGAPAEIVSTTNPDLWPAAVSPGAVLTGAIYDDNVSPAQVFVASSSGFLYRVDANLGGGAVVASGQLAATGFGIDDTPLVDGSTANSLGTAGLVYVFVRGDTKSGIAQRSAVFQIASTFAAGTAGVEVPVSSDNRLPQNALYSGAFDNSYYDSANGTGNLYVCGEDRGATAMWQIPIANGVMGSGVAGPALATDNVACSPLTEIMNGSTDRIFGGVTNNAITAGLIGCPSAGGCVMSFDITNGADWGIGKLVSSTGSSAGGVSGIIMDNVSDFTGASQIYFTPLANQMCTAPGNHGYGGCAIQAPQAGTN